MTLPWPVAVFVTVGFLVIGYVFGAARMTEWQNNRYQFFVGENRRLAANLRVLFVRLGIPYPADDEPDEPQPGRWDRFVQWVADRFRGPAEVEVPSEPVIYLEPGPAPARKLAPDPQPATEPHMPAAPGPATVPSHRAIDDDWRRDSDALYAQMLAEIRGEKVKEGGR
jgi:hypothetical protein